MMMTFSKSPVRNHQHPQSMDFEDGEGGVLDTPLIMLETLNFHAILTSLPN